MLKVYYLDVMSATVMVLVMAGLMVLVLAMIMVEKMA